MIKNRALLLDRDGVINVDSGYVGTTSAFAFMPGVFPFLRSARDLGYRLCILTNQSGVARGLYSESDYKEVTNHMVEGLRREQIEIDLILACFAHPEGKVSEWCRESFWRKPNPGMVLEAERRLNLDMQKSIFLGDSLRDLQAAQQGGVKRCLLLSEKKGSEGISVVANFTEALKELSA